MKKFILSICLSLLLAVGCANLPAIPTNLHVEKPDYIQHIEELYPMANIIRWEKDEYTLWLWVDNNTMPNDCDYAVVYEIIDLPTDDINLLHLWSVDLSDPCGDADRAYEEYLDVVRGVEALAKQQQSQRRLPKSNEI